MSSWYYDWDGTTTTDYHAFRDACTASTIWHCYPIGYWRKMLVERPKHWTEETAEASAKMLESVKSTTGWQVDLIIFGEVGIVNPNIERRTMAEFLPLLKLHASNEHRKIIEDFFAEHPLEETQ